MKDSAIKPTLKINGDTEGINHLHVDVDPPKEISLHYVDLNDGQVRLFPAGKADGELGFVVVEESC